MSFFGLSWKDVISLIRASRRRQLVGAIYSTELTSRLGRALSASEKAWITDLTADTSWHLDQPSTVRNMQRIGLAPWCVLLNGLSFGAASATVNALNNQLQRRFKLTAPVLYLVPQNMQGETLH